MLSFTSTFHKIFIEPKQFLFNFFKLIFTLCIKYSCVSWALEYNEILYK